MIIENKFVGTGFSAQDIGDDNWDSYPWVADSVDAVAQLLALCPAHHETPLVTDHAIEGLPEGARLSIKDETTRMGLGSFKALGAAFVIASHAAAARADEAQDWSTTLAGSTYVSASAGNHGLSIAAGARVFGANAIIVLAETVPSAFAERLRKLGAEVVIHGSDYAQSMDRALELAAQPGAQLLSDTSWPEYQEIPWMIMQGYAQLADEAVRQMSDVVPTKIFLQAGVGGLASACAAVFRRAWGAAPMIYVVEPTHAPALQKSLVEQAIIYAEGPVSNMGRLDCKEPSLLAFKSLVRDANAFVTITDEQALEAVDTLQAGTKISSTPSGAAGLAAMLGSDVQIDADDHVLIVISEGAE